MQPSMCHIPQNQYVTKFMKVYFFRFKKCINAKIIRTVAKEYEYSQATVSDEIRVVMHSAVSYPFSEKEATLLL